MKKLILSIGFFAAAAFGLNGCGAAPTITTAQALELASTAYSCPAGYYVAFETDSTNVNETKKNSLTNKKFFNDIDCAVEADLVSKLVDYKSILPFVNPVVNTGVIFKEGKVIATKYKDINRSFSYEPLRVKDVPKLDLYFKAQGFQDTSNDAKKSINNNKWNLYETISQAQIDKQYAFDKVQKQQLGTPSKQTQSTPSKGSTKVPPRTSPTGK